MPYLFLTFIIFGAYANIFGNEFLFDDDLLIKTNAYLRGWNHVPDILTGSTLAGANVAGGFYRPLQILLYLFIYQLGDGTPFLFHALNLALHIANACLVYKLGTKLGFNAGGAFLAALIWSIHPIHTEAITYMSGTADPLFSLFCLSAIIVLLPDFTTRKILISVPLFLPGLASKETAVMFPLLVMACLFYTSEERLKIRTYFCTWPLWVISVAYIGWRIHAPGLDGPESYAQLFELPGFAALKAYAETPLYRLYTFFATLLCYSVLLAWPAHLHIERTFPIYSTPFFWPVAVGIAISVIAFGTIAFSALKKHGLALSFGLLWFAAAHVPDSGLLMATNSVLLEHWMYLPSAGLFLGLAQTLYALTKRAPRAFSIFCMSGFLIFVFVLSIKTLDQNKIWRTPETLYNNIFANGESSARAHNNLALYYVDRAIYGAAIEQFNIAIRLADAYPETRYNLAGTYLHMSTSEKDVRSAIENLNRSLEINPDFYRSHEMLADIYERLLHDKEKAAFHRAEAQVLISRRK
ncbi:MAG: tetratricopeptide repeat protein [Bdellovibrionales bacterium]